MGALLDEMEDPVRQLGHAQHMAQQRVNVVRAQRLQSYLVFIRMRACVHVEVACAHVLASVRRLPYMSVCS